MLENAWNQKKNNHRIFGQDRRGSKSRLKKFDLLLSASQQPEPSTKQKLKQIEKKPAQTAEVSENVRTKQKTESRLNLEKTSKKNEWQKKAENAAKSIWKFGSLARQPNNQNQAENGKQIQSGKNQRKKKGRKKQKKMCF